MPDRLDIRPAAPPERKALEAPQQCSWRVQAQDRRDLERQSDSMR